MTFKDIFKNSFLNGYASSAIDTKTIIISLSITVVIGVYIFLIYRSVTRKTFYNKAFNLSLPAMAVVTAAIILTIQSNIVLSLGMVGALSIVRFRTAIKDPLDLVFLYWSISVGIICGAGLATIAVVLSVLIAIVLIGLQKYPDKKMTKLLVVNSSLVENDKEILSIIKYYSKDYIVKSKNVTNETLDMIVEVKLHKESEIINEIMKVNGVIAVSLLSHDGEVNA